MGVYGDSFTLGASLKWTLEEVFLALQVLLHDFFKMN